jgi:hypothetical protein
MKWSGFVIWQEVIFVFLANVRRILVFEQSQNAGLPPARLEVAEN